MYKLKHGNRIVATLSEGRWTPIHNVRMGEAIKEGYLIYEPSPLESRINRERVLMVRGIAGIIAATVAICAAIKLYSIITYIPLF